jgi:hypothetical protein
VSLSSSVDYRQGDARQPDCVPNILQEGGYVAVVHAVGLLFDNASGIGDWNRYVSGSGSLPDAESTYDTITRLTATYAIDAAIAYAASNRLSDFPFLFTSAAEAGWPDVTGGPLVERFLAPDFLRRYLAAKRAVEQRLMDESSTLRPVILRPSLIYSVDKPGSWPAVGAFIAANAVGVPFVDRPVTVESLATAMVKSIADNTVRGVQRFQDVDALAAI